MRARHSGLQHPCTRNGRRHHRYAGTSSSQHKTAAFSPSPLHVATGSRAQRSTPRQGKGSSRLCPLQSHRLPAPQQGGQDSCRLPRARCATTPLLSARRQEEGEGVSIQSHFPTNLKKLMQKSSQRLWSPLNQDLLCCNIIDVN